MNINNSNFNAENQQFADRIININSFLGESDRPILELINDEASSEEKKKELITHLEVLKSEDSTKTEKKNAGNKLNKFFESITTETGKMLVKEIFENGADWIGYIGM
jgi:hypothetical protein